MISGTSAEAGDHTVMLTVSNAMGSTERSLVIAVDDQLALTPPIGWNSYDSFDDSVTEDEIIEQAEWLRDNLKQSGWDTVVVDFRWYDPQAPQSDQGNGNNDKMPWGNVASESNNKAVKRCGPRSCPEIASRLGSLIAAIAIKT